MIKLISISLLYIFVIFNINIHASENNKELKIGLLAPFSGDYKSLGNSLLFSTQLALDEINDKKIKIILVSMSINMVLSTCFFPKPYCVLSIILSQPE